MAKFECGLAAQQGKQNDGQNENLDADSLTAKGMTLKQAVKRVSIANKIVKAMSGKSTKKKAMNVTMDMEASPPELVWYSYHMHACCLHHARRND